MLGSFLARALVMVLGYAYPAYECFKTVERNKPEIEQLRFWCQYWILVAVMTVFERFGDTFVSWLPMYSEAKLAFIIYLWYPRTKGTTYVYDSFFKPYVSKHENEIDRNLMELRTRAGDMAYMYCRSVVSYGQTRVFDILQYVAAQSTPGPRPTQPQEEAPRARQATVAATVNHQPTTRAQKPQPQLQTQPQTQPQDEEPLSPTSSTSSSRQEEEVEDDQSSTSTQVPSTSTAPRSPAPTNVKKSVSTPHAPGSPRPPPAKRAETMQVVPSPSKAEKPATKSSPCAEDSVMDDTLRVTRARLRKTQSITTTNTK